MTDLTDRVEDVLLAGAVHQQKLRVLLLFLLPVFLQGQFLLLLLLLEARGEWKSKLPWRTVLSFSVSTPASPWTLFVTPNEPIQLTFLFS